MVWDFIGSKCNITKVGGRKGHNESYHFPVNLTMDPSEIQWREFQRGRSRQFFSENSETVQTLKRLIWDLGFCCSI